MIYTTYFAKLKVLPKSITPISICGKAPAGYDGLQYKKLAPQYWFFKEWKQSHDNEYYISCFKKYVLDKLSISDVLSEIHGMAGGDIALVCYEKPEDFCHRHLVADWLNENGVQCSEWTNTI